MKVLLIVGSMIVAGCSIWRFAHPDLSKVSVGMTKADVVRELGKPDRFAMQDGVEVLSYGWNDPYDSIIGLAWVHVALRDGRVVAYGDQAAVSGSVVNSSPPTRVQVDATVKHQTW